MICPEKIWRIKKMTGYILIVIFYVFPLRTLRAQDIPLHFTRLGIAQGLPQSTVHCVLQDSKGFIWIGTDNGLCRYSDDEIKIFRYDNNTNSSISSNYVQALAEDGRGNILVGTDNGLNIYDTRKEKFRLADAGEPVSDVTCIYKDSKENIWVGASRRFFSYTATTEKLSNVALPAANPPTIRAITEDDAGVLWIGAGARLIRFNAATRQILPLPEILTTNPYYGKSPIHALTWHNGEIWIGTQGAGLFLLDMVHQQCFNYRAGKDSNSITNEMVKAIRFIKGKCWVGTRNGLYIFQDRKVIAHYTNDKFDPATLSHNSVCALMEDKAGTVWIGTYWGGISQVHPGSRNLSFISSLMKDGVGTSNRTVMGIQEDNAHNLWLATGSGLNFYNRVTNTFRYYHIPGAAENINKDIIKSLLFKDHNNLWVGSLEGLYLFNIPSETFTRVPLSTEHPNWIYAVYALEKGANGWWAGTQNGLFFLDEKGNIQPFVYRINEPGSLIPGEINCLHEDRQGNLWVGTLEGLCYLPPNGRRFQRVNYSFIYSFNTINNVHCVKEDSRGIIWVGTHDKGLLYVDKATNSLRAPDPDYAPAEKIIRGIVEDDSANLWLSGQNNIMRISVASKQPATAPDKIKVTQYAGAAWPGINEYLNPAFKTAAGEIMFGGINGIVGFKPSGIIVNNISPKVVLTGMLIKNIPVDIGGKHSPLQESITYTNHITLHHNQAYFTLHFAALNYINPRSNKFAYMMEGLHSDHKWHYVGHQTAATFTNLDPGDYIFHVKATNNDGVWSDAATNLHITVLPPIWRTWYAYLFYGLLVVALLWWYYYYSSRTILLKHEIIKQQLFREKDRELAQSKLDFFTNISHDIKTPLTLIMAPVEKLLQITPAENEAQHQLLLIQQNGERLMRLMDQLLDFRLLEEGGVPLHAGYADIVAFCREITGAFEGLAVRRGITLHMVPATDTLMVWFDKDKFEKILFNLLSNALKFTLTGGTVTVSLCTEEPDTMLLTVEDNGIGIPATHFEEIFGQFRHYDFNNLQAGGTGIGLALVKGLVSRHYGTIAVSSRQASEITEGYTCFSIRIPLGNTHLKHAEKIAAATSGFLVPTPLPDFSSPVPEGEAGKPMLLIVEDNGEVQQYLADVFRERYTLHLAADGLSGMELATRHLPDIIISDVMMPGMNGVELCHALKNDQRTSHIPVILLSARSTVSFIREGYETGADDYITKPFSISLLTSRVKNLLDSRRLLRERYSRNFTLPSDNDPITGPDDVFLKEVIAFIEENMAEPSLNVEELAAAVNMSRVTLYRKLKALTNQTIIEFIRLIRLKKAARLLATQQYNVNEVAYMTGFSDVDYFRKWFKKEFGKTPTEFVKDNHLTS
jgi:ligand-binding sensor domain-containing protein/signal transduction histidine kinase/DNA-binding response OmpR family regulator